MQNAVSMTHLPEEAEKGRRKDEKGRKRKERRAMEMYEMCIIQ